jgi:hypothetical protein
VSNKHIVHGICEIKKGIKQCPVKIKDNSLKHKKSSCCFKSIFMMKGNKNYSLLQGQPPMVARQIDFFASPIKGRHRGLPLQR